MMIQAFIRAIRGLWKWETALLSSRDLILAACTWGPRCCGVFTIPTCSSPWQVTKQAGSLLPWHWADPPPCLWWKAKKKPNKQKLLVAMGNRCSRSFSFWTLKQKTCFYLQFPQLILVYFSLDLAFIVHPNWSANFIYWVCLWWEYFFSFLSFFFSF